MPAEIPLTARQQEIWQFLVLYVDDHGYPPTVREIGEEVGLASPSTVHAHLANLERVGLIRRDPTKPRAIVSGTAMTSSTFSSASSGPPAATRPRSGRRGTSLAAGASTRRWPESSIARGLVGSRRMSPTRSRFARWA